MSVLRAIAIVVVLFFAERLECQEWRYFKPSLKSQVHKLLPAEATSILQGFCSDEVKVVAGVGSTCPVRALGTKFADIVDNSFHPQGVMFGHFLGPESDDAAVSGWSAETHPSRWGGTLLLTKRNGGWSPLWYKSALIVRSCEKMATPESREILLCEDEDSGMGHQLHYLYAVDLKHPADLRQSLLAEAESYSDGCAVQQQVMDPINWTDENRAFSVIVRTTEWHGLAAAPCNGTSPKRPPFSVQIQFVAEKDAVRKIDAP
jgi:hypothetical protein